MSFAVIDGIACYLPENVLTNEELAQEHPTWNMQEVGEKIGIVERHIAAPDECSSDLAVKAAQSLFASGVCSAAEIDYVLFCTQTPDYFLPTTACVIQQRLGIPQTAGAFDFNLGCSGYVYGLQLAKALIESGQASKLLLLTGDTYTKFIHPSDRSVRTLFGDAGTATFLRATDDEQASIGPFVVGTDGRGAPNLIVKTGGMRNPRTEQSAVVETDESGNQRSDDSLLMKGGEIFTFTLGAVPKCVNALLAKADLKMEDIDLFVFHQANRHMLDHLRRKMKIDENKFLITMERTGNTVGSTIPIALSQAAAAGVLKAGQRVMLVGFGVGYSWGATIVRWR